MNKCREVLFRLACSNFPRLVGAVVVEDGGPACLEWREMNFEIRVRIGLGRAYFTSQGVILCTVQNLFPL